MDAKRRMKEITSVSRRGADALSQLTAGEKNRALKAMAEEMDKGRDSIKKANRSDIASAERSGETRAFIDRLTLDDKRIDGMCSMMRDVEALKDPVGEVIEKTSRPNGLLIEKV
ncbi:MAG: gamma-glutamyl-phosphate reductase, partial [Candidatus Omnitrophica bacterium]|nr:gamma-glutamyl-phosphate reductase [Candidatus Omnitrophota bacterium]